MYNNVKTVEYYTNICRVRIAVFVLGVDQHADYAGQDIHHGHSDGEIDQRAFGHFVRGQRHAPLYRSRVNAELRDVEERQTYADGPDRVPQKRIRVHSKRDITWISTRLADFDRT